MSSPILNPQGYEHTLALGSLLKQLGIKGGQVPTIGKQIMPVLIMGAVETLDASPVEARGLAGVSVTPAGSDRASFRLNAVGRALIIQDVFTAFADTYQGRVHIHGESPWPNAVDKVEVGGVQTSAVATFEPTAPFPSGATFFPGDITFPGQRWFVPAGSCWEITTESATGIMLSVCVIWRELPAPIGGP